MTAPSIVLPEPGKSIQRERRVYRVYSDNHGRTFGAIAEMSNNMPCEEMRPVGFSPPWLPPQRYAKFIQDGDLHFTWDYQALIDHLAGIAAQYYRDAIAFAIENNKPEPEPGGPVDRAIRAVLGDPPLSPAIPMAAEAGDPWLLGIPGAPVNATLKAVLEQHAGADSRDLIQAIREGLKVTSPEAERMPKVQQPGRPEKERARTIGDQMPADGRLTYIQFVAEQRKAGVLMSEIPAKWRQYKADLAEAVA